MKNFDKKNIESDEVLKIRQIRQHFPRQNFAPYGSTGLNNLKSKGSYKIKLKSCLFLRLSAFFVF